MTSKTDRNGRETAYTYDAAGRITMEVWLNANDAAVKTYTYTYDTLGRLLTAGDGICGGYTYTYDTMNRVDTITMNFDGQTAVFDYTYDSVGNQTQSALTINNIADRIINTQYDYLGRATSVRLHGSTNSAIDDIMAELEYNANGLATNVNRLQWNDTDEVYDLIAQSVLQYNANNNLTNINYQDATGNSLVSHGYTYDSAGNITQYANSIDGIVSYDYDFLGQLTGADYSNLILPDESYSYDNNGNRITANGDNYTTGDNNELTSDGSYTYLYDAEGNRISKTNSAGTQRELYEWDYRNRLTKVSKQEYNSETESWTTIQIVDYAYDYNNVLIRKTLDANGDGISDSKTIFLPENYQTAVQLDADLTDPDSTDPVITHRYLWTPGQQDKLLADEQITSTGSNILWTLTDHLGTIRDIIQNTSSGLVVPAHTIYDAYGNVLSCKDSTGTDIESPVIFGFTGKYFDADTQLQNNVNRWYDATTGRWLSTDPIGFNGNDTNLYRYVGNRGVSFLDIFGCATYETPESIAKSLHIPIKEGKDYTESRWIKSVNAGNSTMWDKHLPGVIVISMDEKDIPELRYAALIHELLGGPLPRKMFNSDEGGDRYYHNRAIYFEIGAYLSVLSGENGVSTDKMDSAIEHINKRINSLDESGTNYWKKKIMSISQFIEDCKCAEKNTTFNNQLQINETTSHWLASDSSLFVSFELSCENNKIKSKFTIKFTNPV